MILRPTLVMVDLRSERGGAFVTSGSSVTILGPYQLLNRPRRSFTIWNADPTTTLSGARLEINADDQGLEFDVATTNLGYANPQRGPNPSTWETYTTFASNLAPGRSSSVVCNEVFRWFRIQGVSNVVNASVTVATSGFCNAASD